MAWKLLHILVNANRNIRIAVLLAVLVGLGACSDRTGDDGGLDMRSRGSGERDERVGNDPAEQNTGEGSTSEGALDNPPANTPEE